MEILKHSLRDVTSFPKDYFNVWQNSNRGQKKTFLLCLQNIIPSAGCQRTPASASAPSCTRGRYRCSA